MLVGGLKILKKSFALWSHAALYVIKRIFFIFMYFFWQNPSVFPNFIAVGNNQRLVEELPFR